MSHPDLHSTCLQLLRDRQLAAALESLARGASGIDRRHAEVLVAGRLCDLAPPGPRITRLGRTVDYHLAEYRTQVEDGAAQRYLSRLEIGADSRVLDIGCGAGQRLIALLRDQPRLGGGVELDPAALAVFTAFRELEGLHTALPVRANAEALPFADDSFDRVLCRVVLMYVRVLPALAEIARVSAPGALV